MDVFNYGWGTSEVIDFELSTEDTYVTLLNTTAESDSLIRRTGSTATFQAEIDDDCPVGHEIEFTITIDQGGFIRTEEFNMIVGQPEILFEDDAESGMSNWSSTGGWNVANNSSHSGVYSFTESPNGNYSNNLTARMTLINPLNLSDVNTLWMEFWAKWDIEANYDFAQFEVSTDGNNWTPVAGLYTVEGSGIGVQNDGEPGYEGTQATYVLEHINLNQYAGQPYFKFRFEMRSDGGVYGDGWNVDDIKLLGFTGAIIPPEIPITMTPNNPPIIIPASGGQFSYVVGIINNEASAQSFDIWIDVVLPSGSVFGPIIFRPGVLFAPGAQISREIVQIIPAGAPAGVYEFRGQTGSYPNVIYSEDSFEFTKEVTE